MAFVSIDTVAARDPASRDVFGYRIVALLWFLYLFAPQKLLVYYTDAARPLTWMLEVMLVTTSVAMVFTRRPDAPRRGYPAFSILFALTLLGIAMAVIYGEFLPARDRLRQVYQFYLLAQLTVVYCDRPERAKVILQIYFLHFIYFGLWGAVSLSYAPIAEAVDPGLRDIIYWHIAYGNRDAFGPVMVAGVIFSIYYAQAFRPGSKLAVGNVGLCLVGVFTSFGRGVFVSLVVAAGVMWMRARNKLRIALLLAACLSVTPFLAPSLTQRYITSMSTIFTEGTQQGTGADRKILWSWGWRIFKNNPIAGVGPGNFGVVILDEVPLSEAAIYGYNRNTLYGRVTHSMPITLLSEYGILGMLAMLYVLFDFFKTNGAIRQVSGTMACGFSPEYANAVSAGLQTAFISVCVNSLVYPTLYLPLFWHLVTINRMVYFAAGATAATATRPRWWPSRQIAWRGPKAPVLQVRADTPTVQPSPSGTLSSARAVRPPMFVTVRSGAR